MNLVEFTEILFQNIPEYLIILIFASGIYYFSFHKHLFSLFDPLFFENLISSIFATSTVVFLFRHNKIREIYFINYLITLVIFWAIFYVFGKKINKNSSLKFKYKKDRLSECKTEQIVLDNEFYTYFEVFAILNVIIQLLFYVMTGIPLFMNSRLEVTLKGGPLVAILSRIKPLFDTTSVFMSFYIIMFEHGKKRFSGKIYLGVTFVFAYLSGSRSSLFHYIFLYALFVFYTQKDNKFGVKLFTNIKVFILLFVALFFTLSIFAIQSGGNFLTSFTSLFIRFAAYGDTYVYGYVNDNLFKLEKVNLFHFIFDDFLNTFRLNTGTRGLGFGFELNNIVYKINNSVSGPNSRFNLITYSYFGFAGSIISAFIFGSIFAFVRNRLVSAVKYKPKYQVMSYFFWTLCGSVETEPTAMIRFMTTDIFLQFIVFVILTFLVFYSVDKNKKITNNLQLLNY